MDRATDRVLGRFSLTRVGVARALFGEPQSSEVGVWRYRFVLPVLFVLGAAIGLGRIPRASWDIFWAEDANVFFAGSISHAPALAIVTPYNGYLHVGPRLLSSLLTAVVPLPFMAIAFTVAAVAITAALACFVYAASRSRLHLRSISLLVWLSFVTMSMSGGEVLGSIANLHWFFDAAAMWALFTRHRTATMRVTAIVVIVLAILTDGLTLVFIPVVILRFLLLDEPGRRRTLGIVGFAYLVEVVAIVVAPAIGLGTRHPGGWKFPTPSGMLHQFTDRVVWAGIAGVHLTQKWNSNLSILWFLGVILLIIGVFLVVRRARRNRWIALTFLAYSILFFVGTWTSAVGGVGFDPLLLAADGRYSIVPIALLIGFIALAFDDLFSWRALRPVIVRSLVALGGVAMVIVFVLDFHIWNLRAGTEGFQNTIRHDTVSCQTMKPSAVRVVPVAPISYFDIDLTCRQILHGLH